MYGRGGEGKAAIVLLALAACGGQTPAPEAGQSLGGIPDLTGIQVMVLPTQSVAGVGTSPDPELAFALGDRAPAVPWITATRLRDVLNRSPGVRVSLESLAVGAFLRGEVQRVGDPLYGDLRRLSALTDAPLALIPVRVAYAAPPDGGLGQVEIMATLIDARSGRVYWTGVVAGAEGAAGDPGALASAAQELARRLAP